MTSREKDLAICQMSTISTVLSGAGMDIDQAIVALNLDHKVFFDLARREGLDWVADNIRKHL